MTVLVSTVSGVAGLGMAGQKIVFDEIRAGDRVRVRYCDGGMWKGGGMRGGYARSGAGSGVIRTMVAVVVEQAASGTVWLDAQGNTIARRGWTDMEILRLSGGTVEGPSLGSMVDGVRAVGGAVRSGAAWTPVEIEALFDWGVPTPMLAARLGRTVGAVSGRRSMLKKQMLEQMRAPVRGSERVPVAVDKAVDNSVAA